MDKEGVHRNTKRKTARKPDKDLHKTDQEMLRRHQNPPTRLRTPQLRQSFRTRPPRHPEQRLLKANAQQTRRDPPNPE